jgi:hypothetical protein
VALRRASERRRLQIAQVGEDELVQLPRRFDVG